MAKAIVQVGTIRSLQEEEGVIMVGVNEKERRFSSEEREQNVLIDGTMYGRVTKNRAGTVPLIII
jgi:hypothetical protein